jgi:hypothetical protein
MKIPGAVQAGDIFTNGAAVRPTMATLVYYVASDFTPARPST